MNNDMYSEDMLEQLAANAKQQLNDNDDNPYEEFANMQDDDGAEEEYFQSLEGQGIYDRYENLDDIPIDESPLQDVDAIYPGGPGTEQIDIWKQQYPDCIVYAIEVAGEYFVCRSMTRPEYKKLIAMDVNQLQREEVICLTCVLHPTQIQWENIIQMRAGIPSTLAAIIMEHSGFTQNYGVNVL